MTMTGFYGSPEPENVNRLLAPYNMSYGPSLVLQPGPTTTPITNWIPHPITKGITRIGFGWGFNVLGSGTMLANQDGYDLLEAKEVGLGHVVMWGDEAISFNTEWTSHPEYQVKQFWQNIVDWFDPLSGCVVPDPPPPK
jgi:hypothetical protein